VDWMMSDTSNQDEMLREFHTQPKPRDAVQDLACALEVLGRELAGHQRAAHGNAAVFSVFVEGAPHDLHPILRNDAYQIAGEALRNAFRHARARQIEVEILYHSRQLRVRVRDDGIGIDARVFREEGRGLNGMRGRAKRIGGELEVWTRHGAGTEVELSVPAAVACGTSVVTPPGV